MTDILTCHNLSKAYKHFALQNISFSLKSGYLTGLIGKNGAGKTTLLRILAGLDSRFQGNADIQGISLKKYPGIIRDLVGYVSSDLQPFWEKTAIENGALTGIYYQNYTDSLFLKWLNRFGLPPDIPVYHFSKGDRMKFFCCMALSHQPKVLLFDEPFAGFDPIFRKEFFMILHEILEEDIAVLIASHIIEDLDTMADYILCLENGQLIRNESLEEFRDKTPQRKLLDYFSPKASIEDLLD